jgi:hypothetical protein
MTFMSKTQLKILWVGIIIVVLMGLFPPEKKYGSFTERLYISGYDFILNVSNIAFTRLLIQWIIVGVITAGLIYSFKIDPDFLLKMRWRILRTILSKKDYEKKRNEENQSDK